MHVCINIHVYVYIYIYICIQRERERGRENERDYSSKAPKTLEALCLFVWDSSEGRRMQFWSVLWDPMS